MLTPEQLVQRETGIGSSDVSSIVHVNPWHSPLDVWVRKRTPTRGPLVTQIETPQTEVGSEFEEAVARLYARRMQCKLRRSTTLAHRSEAWMLATPDRLITGERAGVEIKLVGMRVAHHWDDGIPDYVRVQVQWQLMVLDYAWWDVAAMLGTELRLHRVYRDDGLEETLLDNVRTFWFENVRGDVPPQPVSEEERARYVRARYPRPTDEMGEPTPEIDAAVQRHIDTGHVLDAATTAHEASKTTLLELLANMRGVKGPDYTVSAPSIPGKVDWKAIATEVANGVVPDEIISRHRGQAYRRLGVYPRKTKGND